MAPVPNPPAMMESTERFMASAMSLVRMLPEAPTRAPATVRMTLASTKPAMATAVPVKALSSEMTTGMSAPPMGRTMSTPTASELTTVISRTGRLWTPAITAIPEPTAATARAALAIRPPWNVTGWLA